MGCLVDCCCRGSGDRDDSNGPPSETTRLLRNNATPVQHIPSPCAGSHITKTDEESALNKILQKTANDVIDVTVVEPHSMEKAEIRGRTKDYHSQVSCMGGVSRPDNRLPVSSHPPNIVLSKDLVSPSDVKFITDRSEATNSAVESMEIKSGEPLVVQFAAT